MYESPKINPTAIKHPSGRVYDEHKLVFTVGILTSYLNYQRGWGVSVYLLGGGAAMLRSRDLLLLSAQRKRESNIYNFSCTI